MCELMVSELGPLLWKCAGDAVHFYLYFNICLKKETKYLFNKWLDG